MQIPYNPTFLLCLVISMINRNWLVLSVGLMAVDGTIRCTILSYFVMAYHDTIEPYTRERLYYADGIWSYLPLYFSWLIVEVIMITHTCFCQRIPGYLPLRLRFRCSNENIQINRQNLGKMRSISNDDSGRIYDFRSWICECLQTRMFTWQNKANLRDLKAATGL